MRTVLIATALAGWSMWCLAAQAPEAGAQAAQQPAASPAPQNPPADANANGRRLSSASRGWWSDAIASIVPSANAAITAFRSCSLRNGGDSFA